MRGADTATRAAPAAVRAGAASCALSRPAAISHATGPPHQSVFIFFTILFVQ